MVDKARAALAAHQANARATRKSRRAELELRVRKERDGAARAPWTEAARAHEAARADARARSDACDACESALAAASSNVDEAASRLAAAELGAETAPSAAAARERAEIVEAVARELDAPVPREARFDANLAAAPPPPPPPPQLPPPDERAIVERLVEDLLCQVMACHHIM